MNKSMIVRAVSITGALALLGGATFATFSATASNTGNTFGAGTLHLSLKEYAKDIGTPIFTWTNAKPGEERTQVIELKNDGSLDGTLKLSSINVTPTPGTHDVSGVLTLTLWNDLDHDGVMDGGLENVYQVSKLNGTGSTWTDLPVGDLNNDSELRYLGAKLVFDSGANSDYQGEGANFGFNFYVEQK
jgi:hypothetical protein